MSDSETNVSGSTFTEALRFGQEGYPELKLLQSSRAPIRV